MLHQLSPPVCCSPPAAVIMVSPPPQFAGGDSPPKHFIWPEPLQARPKGHAHHKGPATSPVGYCNNKRKSAVEMLQESKAYYVKSEHVLDKKQVLRTVGHLRAPPPRPKTHHRTVSLDKAALLLQENTPPPRVPERSCSQSPPPLPPKSPRIAPGRPRAKTLVLPPVARRQANNCDVQMRLRQLLSNSSSTDREVISNGYRRLSDEDARHIDRDDEVWLNEDDSAAFDTKTIACEKIYPSSRHSTPSAASRSLLSPVTHKSLPDLSPNKHGDDSSSTTSSSNRCYYPSSRATSDYVSRSPSSCKCCGSRLLSEVDSPSREEEDKDQQDELLSPDDDSARRKPVLRSKSDISHRYSRPAFLAPVPRTELDELPIKTTEEVQQFFEHLGLGEDAYHTLTRRSSHDSPIYFGSVSSVESWPGAYLANSEPEKEENPVGPGGTKLGEQPSIVERNARIIKWLCNCRKAQSSALS